jgi:hypothetical protein
VGFLRLQTAFNPANVWLSYSGGTGA